MQDKKSLKKLAYSYAAYGGASIFGPMIIFGVAGYVLDMLLGTKFMVLAGVGTAFITTNILIHKKTKKISKIMNEMSKKEENRSKKQ